MPKAAYTTLVSDSADKFNRQVTYTGGKVSVQWDKAAAAPVELMIYQDIGDDPWGESEGLTAKMFKEALSEIPRNTPLDIRINSAGGSVWEGLAIKTAIDEWPGKKTASIDGMAASVASWLPMSVDEIRAPRHAQLFIHDAWGMCMGNAEDMRQQAAELDKTSQQIAGMYAGRTGKTVDECRSLMKASTLMTGEEALQLGFIDRLTDAEPIQNFTDNQLNNMRAKLAVLNTINTPQRRDNFIMKLNRKEKIWLLNHYKISTSKNATDKFLDTMLAAVAAMPENSAKFRNGKDGDHADDCDCAQCAMKNAPEPDAEEPDPDAPDGAPGTETELWKASTENALKKQNERLEKFFANQRRSALVGALDKCVEDGRIAANDHAGWLEQAMNAKEDDDGNNPILKLANKQPVYRPGRDPLNIIELGESDSVADLDRNVNKLLEAQDYFNRSRRGPESLRDRIEIGNRSKEVARLINRFKKYDSTPRFANSMTSPLPGLTGPLVDAWNKFAVGGGPRNANTMSASLLRQVILSEVMRAFRRQFASLEIFCHNFGNVPLEGTDYVEVPYYPLATTPSSEFVQANGYVIGANAVTSNKQIFVGGIGNGVATPGSGRKYQTLQFSAYEIRRQPWLDIQKLSILAGEQLAIDVRGDILGTQINAANFGNAIWTGAAGGFDHTVVGNTLLQAAIKGFWPLRGRNVVLAPGYYTNLAIDPGITPLLAIGTTDVLREGIVGGLYGFENIIHDPLIPVANSIRGGDGQNIAGTDPNLAGFMAWPSAILVATAPIMPPPGVLKKLVAYEQITDDQTGLAITYQFFGEESRSRDNEIIECTYGSGLGELAALYRITSQGN